MASFSAGLDRFIQAQAGEGSPSNADALQEIQAGRKVSHWIWYVLPQLAGLGHANRLGNQAQQGLQPLQPRGKGPSVR